MAKIFRTVSYYSAGRVNDKPAFHILSGYKVTITPPKWLNELIKAKKISVAEIEAAFRDFKQKFRDLDFDLVTYQLYHEPVIVLTTSIDGRPQEANNEFKSQMRLLNVLYNNFLNEFKPRVDTLRGYSYNKIRNRVVSHNYGKKPVKQP